MLEAALEHYTAQQALAATAAALSARLWASKLDPANLDGSFTSDVAPSLLALLIRFQQLAAGSADDYVNAVLLEQGLALDAAGEIIPQTFTALASDGRDLPSLLREPVIRVKVALAARQPLTEALLSGAASLARIVSTQVADAGRNADGVALTARPHVEGYARMLTLPSCSRCVVLAGKFYKWNSGFRRHPRCDCRHIPANEDNAGDLRTDPRAAIAAGKVTGLSAADSKAIDDGSDPAQVINAQRGTYTADAFGKQLLATTEATSKRGQFGKAELAAGRKPGKTPRLRPEEIYRIAGDDRTEALRLLERFGYLSPAP